MYPFKSLAYFDVQFLPQSIHGYKHSNTLVMAGVIRTTMVASLLLIFLIAYLPAVHSQDFNGNVVSGELQSGKLGAVASESALCSHHGTDILERGGNAADAVSWFWPS